MGLGDLLGGKEKTIKKDPLADDINSSGKQGLSMLKSGAAGLNKFFYSNPQDSVNAQIDSENKMLRSSSQDAIRKTRDMVAQRGMGNSSIGLGEEINQGRVLSDKLALNKATGLDRIRSLLNEQMNTGSQLFNVKSSQGPIQMQDVKYKTGGIAPLLGAGVGGYLGGASGAQVGMGLGQYLAS